MEDRLPTSPFRRGTISAVFAALCFGATTPLIQKAGQGAGAISVAALLYAGAALASIEPGRSRADREAPVPIARLPRLLFVALSGAVAAPVLLAWGLQHTGAAGASLLLNFEAVFTVLLGWLFFHEHVGWRVGLAVVLMAGAGACLIYNGGSSATGWGAAAIVLATFAWALDNVLTRPLADLNPTQVVRWKGSLGAFFTLAVSLVAGQPFPSPRAALLLLLCGATGYGLSLRLYLRAQRAIGAARTGSLFAIAPFVGAAVAVALGDRTLGIPTAVSAVLFGVGIYLHLTESHQHMHTHEAIEHEHAHRHDDGHHDHQHDGPVQGEHSHVHRHEARTHQHPHGPDVHHQHRH